MNYSTCEFESVNRSTEEMITLKAWKSAIEGAPLAVKKRCCGAGCAIRAELMVEDERSPYALALSATV